MINFSHISERFLTKFVLPMPEGNLWEICVVASGLKFLRRQRNNHVITGFPQISLHQTKEAVREKSAIY